MKGWTFPADGSGKPSEGPIPDDLETDGTGRARRAHRDGRRSRRCADGEVLRVRHAHAGGTGRRTQARRRRGRGSSRSSARRRRRTSACSRCSTPSCHFVPSPAERPFSATAKSSDDERRREGGRRWPCRGLRVEDGRRSVRRTHHDVPRHLRHREGRLDAAEPHARRRRAVRPPDAAAGKDADQRARDPGRRPRRRGQAEGHADERPARRQGDRVHGARRSSSPSR